MYPGFFIMFVYMEKSYFTTSAFLPTGAHLTANRSGCDVAMLTVLARSLRHPPRAAAPATVVGGAELLAWRRRHCCWFYVRLQFQNAVHN